MLQVLYLFITCDCPLLKVQGPGHPDELTVELTVEGKKFTLELELNK